ncbi:MAG: hypothetical protein J6U54_07725 [Clostridiales bacterium]|nr:hypothetical protein [Clostridiales bacterium]
MLSDVTVGVELKARKELVESLIDSIQYERAVFNNEESTDEERRIAEARLRDLAKTLNEVVSTNDHAYMSDQMKMEIEKLNLEIEKLEATAKETKKTRWYDGLKTLGGWVVGGVTTAVSINAARKNMEVAKGIEEEKYLATEGEKQAIRSGMDVHGIVQKFERKMGVK